MLVNLPGLEGYTNGQGEGGTDRESDEALYLRVVEARQRPATSGNGWDYRRWALAVEGVGEVKVVELWNGPGTVGLTLTDSNFRGASPEIIQAVLAKRCKPLPPRPPPAFRRRRRSPGLPPEPEGKIAVRRR